MNVIPNCLFQTRIPLSLVIDDEQLGQEAERLLPYVREYVAGAKTPRTLYAWFIVDPDMPEMADRQLVQLLEAALYACWGDAAAKLDVEPLLVRADPERFEPLLEQMEPIVHDISLSHPFDALGQLIPLGHPNVQRALLLEGVRQWEDRYCSVYWSGASSYVVRTHNMYRGKDWTTMFKQFVHSYDYNAAETMLREIAAYDTGASGDSSVYGPALSLLRMMKIRLNFDFASAYQEWGRLDASLRGYAVLRAAGDSLEKLQLPSGQQAGDLARLVELFRHLELYLELGDWPSFLIRFYRAREAVLLYIMKYGAKEKITLERTKTIHERFDAMDQLYAGGQLDGFYGAYFYCKSKNVIDTLSIRNRTFVGHGRKSIEETKLWEEYAGYPGTTIPKAARRFRIDTELLLRDLGVRRDNQFKELNQWIVQFLQKAGNGVEDEVAAAAPGS